MLARIVYHSESRLEPAGHDAASGLNAILDLANRNNERDGITGALLFDGAWFVQILEGDREAISAALWRIARDPRHDNVTVIETRTIRQRSFANWRMGLAVLRGDNAALFERYGVAAPLDPRLMNGEQALGLARDLAGSALARRVTAPAA